MKPRRTEPTYGDTERARPRESDDRLKTLLVHVPKSGGTTLDCIFRDHFCDTPLYPPVGPNKLGDVLDQLNAPDNRYVGGHYPIGAVNFDSFDCKVTILRNPLDIICSRLSFQNKLANAPQESLTPLELSGRKMQVYERYFSPRFDRERCKIDARAGMFQGVQQYVVTSDMQEICEQVVKFDYVIDFAKLDDEIKFFIISNKFFPYRSIEKKRAYSYEPDRNRARKLLCEFDHHFYETASLLFRRVPSDIKSRYEQYRSDYCESQGLSLQVHQGHSIDLRGPIGSGWFNVEIAEHGEPFRWSENLHATVEIPVARAGLYRVQLYVTASAVEGFRLTASTTRELRTFPVIEERIGGVRVFTTMVTTGSHDWIHVDIGIDKSTRDSSLPENGDVRPLGISLGRVYIVSNPL